MIKFEKIYNYIQRQLIRRCNLAGRPLNLRCSLGIADIKASEKVS